MISLGRVFARATPATWRGHFIQIGRAISFRIVDPGLERREGPARCASAQMYRRGESVRRDPTVKRRTTQRSYSQDIPKSKEGRSDRRAIPNAGLLAREVAQALGSHFSHQSTRTLAASEKCLRKWGWTERSLEQGS